MITTRTRTVVLIGAFLYVSATAFAGGVAADRGAGQRKVEAGSAAGDAVQVVW